jgi:hypothetical protein
MASRVSSSVIVGLAVVVAMVLKELLKVGLEDDVMPLPALESDEMDSR